MLPEKVVRSIASASAAFRSQENRLVWLELELKFASKQRDPEPVTVAWPTKDKGVQSSVSTTMPSYNCNKALLHAGERALFSCRSRSTQQQHPLRHERCSNSRYR